MWPKVIAQLFELLPHVSRLLPMADRALQSRARSEQQIAEMAAGVRGDLDRVGDAHAGLQSELGQIRSQVATVAIDAQRTRMAAELTQNRAEELERQVRSLSLWVKVGTTLLLVLLLVLIALVVRER